MLDLILFAVSESSKAVHFYLLIETLMKQANPIVNRQLVTSPVF